MDSTRRKFLDISYIGVADIAATAIATVFWLYMAAVLGPEKYGEITYLLSIAALVSGLSVFGSNHTMLVISAKKIKIHATIYALSLVIGTVGSMVVFLLFLNAGVSLVIMGYLVFMLVTSDLLGRKLYKKYSKNVLVQKALLVVLGIGLYYVLGETGMLIGIGLSHMPVVIEIVREFKRSRIDFAAFKVKKRLIFSSLSIEFCMAC